MSKDDKKEKGKEEQQVSSGQAAGETWLAREGQLAGNYSDGHPLDCVQYLEAKLILKPDRFTCVDSFRDFGKLVSALRKT